MFVPNYTFRTVLNDHQTSTAELYRPTIGYRDVRSTRILGIWRVDYKNLVYTPRGLQPSRCLISAFSGGSSTSERTGCVEKEGDINQNARSSIATNNACAASSIDIGDSTRRTA